MEEEVKEEKEVKRKRLSPAATLILTIGATAIVVVLLGIIHAII